MKRLSIVFVFCLMLQLVAAAIAVAGDATSFDPTRVAVVAKGAGGVPVGTIVAWPVAKNPEDMDNWLECNGQTINATVYPELFALIGAKTPDYRGEFLRGHDAGRGIDPGRSMGSTQTDTLLRPSTATGSFSANMNGNGLFRSASGVFRVTGYTGQGGVENNSAREARYNNVELALDQMWAADKLGTEVRPRNVAVRYFIRARL